LKRGKILCDGCSRGNPGPAGIGYIISSRDGEVLARKSEFIGIATNNEAEYLAAIRALEEALKIGLEDVELYADSELLVKQITGEYEVHSKNLRGLHLKLKSLTSSFKSLRVGHVSREMSWEADGLANEAVERWLMGRRIVKFSPTAARFVGELVKRGGVIVYPTDTVYGLGCDPMNEAAVMRVKRMKGRGDKPLPILVNSVEKAVELGEFDDAALELAYRLWPGQLTIIVPASETGRRSPALFGSNMIGLRIPASMQAIELIRWAGGAIVGTSANLSGSPAARSLAEVDQTIIEAADLVIDGGRCPVGEASTVIKISGGVVEIVREGALKAAQIKPVIEEVGLSLKI